MGRCGLIDRCDNADPGRRWRVTYLRSPQLDLFIDLPHCMGAQYFGSRRRAERSLALWIREGRNLSSTDGRAKTIIGDAACDAL